MKLSDYKSVYSMKASKINGFVNSDAEFNRESVKKWLNSVLSSDNISNKKIIDTTAYERLIFVFYHFKDDSELQELIDKIFSIISLNYIERKKYINKI